MIKKNTKVIFVDGNDNQTDDLVGGMPLSKGEIVHVHKNNQLTDYEVIDKNIECFLDGEDQTVNITYTLKKK